MKKIQKQKDNLGVIPSEPAKKTPVEVEKVITNVARSKESFILSLSYAVDRWGSPAEKKVIEKLIEKINANNTEKREEKRQ